MSKCIICKVSIKNWRKYCSRFCYYKTISARTSGKNNPMWDGGEIKRICRICNKEFSIQKHRLKRKNGALYCSVICQSFAKSGENSPHWKGDSIGYSGIHHWVKKNYGKPNECKNKFCPKTSINYHWANISDSYKRDIRDWVRLCASCHKVFDCKKMKFQL